MNQINPNPTQLPHCKYLQTSHVAPGQIDRTYTKSHKTTKTTASNQPFLSNLKPQTCLHNGHQGLPHSHLAKHAHNPRENLHQLNRKITQSQPNPTQPNTKRSFWNRPNSPNTMRSLVPPSLLLLLLRRRRRRTARCTTLSKRNHRIPTLNCTQHIPPLIGASAIDPPPQI
jgi:hypothetical protein